MHSSRSRKDLLTDVLEVIIRPRSTLSAICSQAPGSLYVFPLVLFEAALAGVFYSSITPYLVSNGMIPPLGPTQFLPTQLTQVVQLSVFAVVLVEGVILWVLSSAALYIAARLLGGKEGFHRPMVAVGFSLLPTSIYYILVTVLSIYSPSSIFLHFGRFEPLLYLRLTIHGWSTLLLAWGVSYGFEIGFRRSLLLSLALNSASYLITTPSYLH